MSIGERVVERYIKHPAPANGWLADGDPLDAGTAHIVHSNLSHLSERNVRLIAHTPGPGDVENYSGTTLGEVYDTAAADPLNIITWYRHEAAALFGPIALAHTRIGAAPAGLYPRKVRVVVQAYKTGDVNTTFYVYAALTATPDTPRRSARYDTAYDSVPAIVGAQHVFDMTLSCDNPVRPIGDPWRSRESGANEPATTALVPAWVWVGWRSEGTYGMASYDRIESISVFEVWT